MSLALFDTAVPSLQLCITCARCLSAAKCVPHSTGVVVLWIFENAAPKQHARARNDLKGLTVAHVQLCGGGRSVPGALGEARRGQVRAACGAKKFKKCECDTVATLLCAGARTACGARHALPAAQGGSSMLWCHCSGPPVRAGWRLAVPAAVAELIQRRSLAIGGKWRSHDACIAPCGRSALISAPCCLLLLLPTSCVLV